jgi:hypothetical protein
MKISKYFTVLAISSLLFSGITASSANVNNTKTTTTESSQSSQSSLATKLPNGKKKLKSPLKLDFTSPRWGNTLSKEQRNAILKGIRKWKLDLPIDNTFTVTGILNFEKDETGRMVVYMRSETLNPNYKTNFKPSVASNQQGDVDENPQYIKTEFNVLLKTTKDNKWKAILEQDNELKTESADVIKNKNDEQAIKDIFGLGKQENKFTDTQEVLIDDSTIVSSSSSTNTSLMSTENSSNNSSVTTTSSNSNTTTQSSFMTSEVSNSSEVKSSVSSSISTQTTSSSSSSTNSSSASSSSPNLVSKVVKAIFGFGSVSAKAGEYDYSWPWKNGASRSVNGGWHGDGFDTESPSQALDIGLGSEEEVLAPITANVDRYCSDYNQQAMGFGNMKILHIKDDPSYPNYKGFKFTKGQKIGVTFNPYNSKNNKSPSGRSAGWVNDGYGGKVYRSACGDSYASHIHIKFFADNMVVDGTKITYGKTYTSFTSKNSLENTQYVLFRDFNNGNNSIWGFANTTHTGDTSFPNYIPPEWKVAGMGDFNGDGYADIFWRNSNTGQNVIWEMKNGAITQDWGIISTVGLEFSVAGIGDFNGDGKADVLWRNASGQNVIWNYNRNQKIGDSGVFSNVPTSWKIISVADFNNDGKADIFWRNTSGQNVIWNMNNASIIQNGSDGLGNVGPEFYVAGVGDFNNDGKADIFWRNTSGQNVIWNMNNRSTIASASISSVGNDFIVAGLGDFNKDGKADIFWRNQNGQQNVIWNMNNTAILTNTQVGTTGASNTQVKGIFTK